MVIGLGIILIVIGAVFAFDVIKENMSVVDGHTLGWILIVAGVLAIVLSLVVNEQRSRRTRTGTVVEERRVDPL